MGTAIRPTRRHALPALVAGVLAATSVMVAPVANIVQPSIAAAAGTFGDPHFDEDPVFTGLDHPTTVRFASDGRAYVAEKGGVVKEYDSVDDTTPKTVIDISADVMNYWDRGLDGMVLDPGFLDGSPYLYLFYASDINVAQTPGAPATWPDSCPLPPGGTTDGCTVMSHLDRVQVNTTTNVAVPNTRTNLLTDWCQQFPSHSGGGMAFGPDGQLYLTGGDGASFNGMDYGQLGGTKPDPTAPVTKVNSCGDPVKVTSPSGSPPTVDPVSAEGGMLRSQDIRTTADPIGLDGTLIRIDPATGDASSGNPLASQSAANARRIVGHGFRNPYRLTFRPGTSDLYIGDVGNGTWEEINRFTLPTSARTPTTLPNFGWPCYEGAPKQVPFDSLHTTMCTNIYNQSGAVTAPLYQYSHTTATGTSTTGPCFVPIDGKETSSVTGLAFYEGAKDGAIAYPGKYKGALFFVDYSRDCLAAILPGTNGVPDPTKVDQIAVGVGNPVDLEAGPGGDLYYVDHEGGRVVRVRYLQSPVARATATPSPKRAPVTVHLDGSASTEPNDGFAIDGWRWDLDHDGTFDGGPDASGQTVDWHIDTPGIYPITLQVHSTSGLTGTVGIVVDASDDAPVPVIDTPSSSLKWSVGDKIDFTGHATDTEDGTIPGSSLHWTIVMVHCPAGCHEHTIETKTGAFGSFQAPDHEYPSHLELRLTATDSHGAQATTAVDLQPNTDAIHVASSPTGVPISIDAASHGAPWTATVIAGGTATISGPLSRNIGGARYRFSTWDDSRVRVRNLTVNGNVNLKATYVPDAPESCGSATTRSPKGSWIAQRTSGNDDVDWFEFHLSGTRKVVARLKDLPVNLRLDLYSSCSHRLTGSNASGTQSERIARTLHAGTYRVRVRGPVNGWSATPYLLRFRVK